MMLKQLSKIIILSMVFLFTIVPVVGFAAGSVVGNPTAQAGASGNAGGGQYTPITPGYQSFFKQGTSFEGMISSIFIVAVSFSVLLAVIMMIAGGIQYMGSESVFSKGAGKDKIYAALGGLLIALISILLISTIVPGFKGGNKFEINIFND